MRRAFLLVALLTAATSTAGAAPQRAEHACVRGGELWFKAADGTKLVGHRFGKGTAAVILGHQSGGDLCEWLPYARRLASTGYFVFAIDFRGHGFSKSRTGPAANRLAADLTAATREVRKLGKRKVFLVGASMGGIASLVAAANVKPPVDGVVSVSSPARFRGMDAAATAPRLRVPVLYLAAEADDNAGFDFSQDAEAMHAATASADKRARAPPGKPARGRPRRRARLGRSRSSRRSFGSTEVFRDHRVEHPVHPATIPRVRLSFDALADEPRALGVPLCTLVEAVDLELDPVKAKLSDQIVLQEPGGVVGEPAAAEVGMDGEAAHVGDPAAAVTEAPAHRACGLAVELDGEEAAGLGVLSDLLDDPVPVVGAHSGEEGSHVLVAVQLDQKLEIVRSGGADRNGHRPKLGL